MRRSISRRSTVASLVSRRIVFEESIEPQPLPVQVFHVAADQLRQVPIDPQTVGQRQRLDGSFNFLHRAHAGVYLLHANAAFKGVVLNDDYTVLVKSGAFKEAGDAGQLLKPHAGRQILLPNTRGLWPNPLFLGWHRANHGFEGIR
jgi:hypothetical protein